MKAIIQETSKRNSSYRNVHYMWQMEKCMQICLIKKKKKDSETIVLKLLGLIPMIWNEWKVLFEFTKIHSTGMTGTH